MALNFPSSPTIGQVYFDEGSGFYFEWDGSVWISYSPSSSNQIKILDDFSASFDGVQTTFPLTSEGVPILPRFSKSLIINLGGVVQDPSDDYSVSDSNIIFSTPPASGLTFSGISLGPAVPVNFIDNGSITPEKLSTGGPYWSTDGQLVVTGTGSTSLVVNGNARVTGILTVGTSSNVVINGTNDRINVGAGVAIDANGINVSGVITSTTFQGNLTGDVTGNVTGNVFGNATGLIGSPNLDVGIITATTAFVGSAVTINSSGINVTGVVTATSFSGDGSNLTGLSESGRLLRAPRILTSGTSYTTPADCTSIYVECVGAGGGGAYGGAVYASAGGGAGGYTAKYFTVSPSTSYSYVIGTGGLGGTVSSVNGNDGGATTFTVGATTLFAGGGSGAISNTSRGGTGGTANGGDLNVNGTSGGSAWFQSSPGAAGGSSFFGGGGSALSGAGTAGGGGGGANANSAGGPGGDGLIRIWEYT